MRPFKRLLDELNHGHLAPTVPYKRHTDRSVLGPPADAGFIGHLDNWSERSGQHPKSAAQKQINILQRQHLQGTARCGTPKIGARLSGVTPSDVVGGLITVSHVVQKDVYAPRNALRELVPASGRGTSTGQNHDNLGVGGRVGCHDVLVEPFSVYLETIQMLLIFAFAYKFADVP